MALVNVNVQRDRFENSAFKERRPTGLQEIVERQ